MLQQYVFFCIQFFLLRRGREGLAELKVSDFKIESINGTRYLHHVKPVYFIKVLIKHFRLDRKSKKIGKVILQLMQTNQMVVLFLKNQEIPSVLYAALKNI